uniref:NET domain-containing protein n=1 Tax=Sarcoptes scabiei TaxID=52283 RepID=A0A834RFL2_SARSC
MPEFMKTLRKKINKLRPIPTCATTYFEKILSIIKSFEPYFIYDEEQNIEVDLGKLQPKTLIALRKLATSSMLNRETSSSSSSSSSSDSDE